MRGPGLELLYVWLQWLSHECTYDKIEHTNVGKTGESEQVNGIAPMSVFCPSCTPVIYGVTIVGTG